MGKGGVLLVEGWQALPVAVGGQAVLKDGLANQSGVFCCHPVAM